MHPNRNGLYERQVFENHLIAARVLRRECLSGGSLRLQSPIHSFPAGLCLRGLARFNRRNAVGRPGRYAPCASECGSSGCHVYLPDDQ
jgi:hypothetical protein